MGQARYKTAAALDNSRRASRDAKRRRTGRCALCGTVTRYGGTPGKPVSDHCHRCAAAASGVSKRGTGSTNARVLERLEHGPATYTEIREMLGLPNDRVGPLFVRLVRYGLIVRVRRGVYALPDQEASA